MITERGILTSSLRRINASRANGARSRGPSTPEGKARSSRNATRHGLLSRQSITPDESDTAFQEILACHLRCFAALPGVNPRILHEMALCRWRLRKAWATEKQWLDELIAADPHPDPRRQVANAFATLSGTNKHRLLFRYEGRLLRFYEQSLQTILRLQTRNDESNLIPFSDTLQMETEPPQPIHAPETKNDERNLIPFSNTAQSNPGPHSAPLHAKVYVEGGGDDNSTLQIQCRRGFSSFCVAHQGARAEFLALVVDSEGPAAGNGAWEHDKRRPPEASSAMEAWFHAHKEILQVYYGQGFRGRSAQSPAGYRELRESRPFRRIGIGREKLPKGPVFEGPRFLPDSRAGRSGEWESRVRARREAFQAPNRECA